MYPIDHSGGGFDPATALDLSALVGESSVVAGGVRRRRGPASVELRHPVLHCEKEMPDLLRITGSLASIAGLRVTFAQWWQQRRGNKKKATSRQYLDWLRQRARHADLVKRIEESKATRDELSARIKTLKTSSDERFFFTARRSAT